jgi:hypothetical protein
VKWTVLVLSAAFAALGIAGIVARTTLWLAWLDLLVAAVGLAAAPALSNRADREAIISGGECVGAAALWIVALATRHNDWLTWWTLAFAVAFFATAAVGARSYGRAHASA